MVVILGFPRALLHISLLDKFHLTESRIYKLGTMLVKRPDRITSNHYPPSNIGWGPCPFHFENSWLQIPSFRALVEEWWINNPFVGWLDDEVKRVGVFPLQLEKDTTFWGLDVTITYVTTTSFR